MQILFLLLFLPALLLARPRTSPTVNKSEVPFIPSFTGPLLAPTPVNMKPGHPSVEPLIGIFNFYGRYDANWSIKNDSDTWAINPLVDYQFAITSNTGIEILASSITNFRNGTSSTQLEDTLVFFGYQVSNDQKGTWVPDFRLFLDVTFPSGSHDELEPSLEGIDSSGQGAYFLGPNLAFQKLFYLPNNFFSLHWSVGYFFPTEARIKGRSVYGGGRGTKGRIRPGQFLLAFVSGEYAFNQNWVFQFDTEYLYQRASSRFRGAVGINEDGVPAEVGLPASLEISVATGLEYNFTPDAGILFGSWFSVAGFNTKAFASVYCGFVYTF